ncbi:MAG: hypothetical protein IK020_11370 [Clostridiales bacterium]|nr:hypothetical protein [Clostridiales bacterium]
MTTFKLDNGKTVKVISSEEEAYVPTPEDEDMDARARQAVKVAIEKAKFLKKPIARYDEEKKQAYLEYPDGRREYVG